MPSPSAVPAPSPGVPTGNPGYINNSTSGVLPTTGTSACDFSGPWYIETQEMNVDYIRIPRHNLPTPTIGLSGIPNVTFNIAGTKLVARITTSVNRQKVEYECYDTSSWQQGQKFALLAASADHQGSSYGSDADFDASTMGPAGMVVTYQPYYRRRPWLASDSTSGITATLYNSWYAVRNSESCGHDWSGMSIEDAFFNGNNDFFWWGGPGIGDRGCHRSNGGQSTYDDVMGVNGPNHYIPGQYEYSKESFYGVTGFVDGCGIKMTNEQLYPEVWTHEDHSLSGNQLYDYTRHDWS